MGICHKKEKYQENEMPKVIVVEKSKTEESVESEIQENRFDRHHMTIENTNAKIIYSEVKEYNKKGELIDRNRNVRYIDKVDRYKLDLPKNMKYLHN